MKNISKVTAAIVVILLMGVSFYSGTIYGRTRIINDIRNAQQEMAGPNGQVGIFGKIMSKNGNNLTVSLPDGGSRIIFFEPSTPILTVASGTPADLIVGKEIAAQGTVNQDGSLNATGISVR